MLHITRIKNTDGSLLADDTLVTLEKSYAKILKQKYDFLEKKGKS